MAVNCPIVPVVSAVASIAITGLVYRLIYYVADQGAYS
jgi:hypothetical protein